MSLASTSGFSAALGGFPGGPQPGNLSATGATCHIEKIRYIEKDIANMTLRYLTTCQAWPRATTQNPAGIY